MNKLKETLNVYVSDQERIRNNIFNSSTKTKKKPHFKPVLASFTLFLLVIGSYLFYQHPTAYVSVDINPSIMISTNAFDKVVKVEALNEEAKTILNDLNLNNTKVTKAVDQIIDQAAKLNYLDNKINDNAILISTYCNNQTKRDKLQQQLHRNINSRFQKKGISSLIIDREFNKNLAHKKNHYHVSEAKVALVNQALKENPDLKFDDLINQPIREIVKYLDSYQNITPKQNKPDNKGKQTNMPKGKHKNNHSAAKRKKQNN